MAPKKPVARKVIPAAPRGFFRGPLPLPGRTPVSLDQYRQAAIRGCEVKHRDQARDKWVLARNRRAQLSAGYIPSGYEQMSQYPMIEGQYPQAPLQITAPPVADFGYGFNPVPAVDSQYYGTQFAQPLPVSYGAPVSNGPQVFQSAPVSYPPQFSYIDSAPISSYSAPLSYGAPYIQGQQAFPLTNAAGFDGQYFGSQFVQAAPATSYAPTAAQYVQTTPVSIPGAYSPSYSPVIQSAYTPSYPTTFQ